MTTRRNFIAGSAAATVAVSIPATAVSAVTIDRTAWDQAFASLAKINAEDNAFTPGWLSAGQRCQAECKAIPHVTFPPETYTGGRCQTTASAIEVRQARKDIELLDAGKMKLDDLPGLREHYDIKRKLVDAADERESAIQAIRDRYNMDALDDKAEQLGDAIAEAESRLMDTPAPDLKALRWKLEKLREPDGGLAPYTGEYVEQTFKDIDRLLT